MSKTKASCEETVFGIHLTLGEFRGSLPYLGRRSLAGVLLRLQWIVCRYVRVEGERGTVRVECLARECNTRPAMAKASPTCVRVNVD